MAKFHPSGEYVDFKKVPIQVHTILKRIKDGKIFINDKNVRDKIVLTDRVIKKVACGFPLQPQIAFEDMLGRYTIEVEADLWSILQLVQGNIKYNGVEWKDLEDAGLPEGIEFELWVVKHSESARYFNFISSL